MSSALNQQPAGDQPTMIDLTLSGCRAAHVAARAVTEALATGQERLLDSVRQREEELDSLDREINEGVTSAITHCTNAIEARELLACLKFILELERIGDLLLSFANRMRSCGARIDETDRRDLGAMAGLLARMLDDGHNAFASRNPNQAAGVIRADAEMDRLRNLMFVRHIENPEGAPRAESFHVVFMAQMLERAGDHAKNMAEEVVHLVTGRSVRHLLRTFDKPWENMFVDFMRKKSAR